MRTSDGRVRLRPRAAPAVDGPADASDASKRAPSNDNEGGDEQASRNVVVVGTQWGDEGKGKVVDWLTDHAQGVVRFQGGHNAGHTLVIKRREDGAAADPVGHHARPASPATSATAWCCRPGASARRDRRLEATGLEVRSRLSISESCPLILPFHVDARQRARGAARASGAGKIGTTGKGIGPAYEDKVARRALRVQDLKHPERFATKLRELLDLHNFALDGYLARRAARVPADPRRGDEGRASAQADDGRRPLRAQRRAIAPAPTCCSKARRARCSTSTTAPIRT